MSKWTWDNGNVTDREGRITPALLDDDGFGVLCCCDGVDNAPTAKEACLIAYAPDLLEALEEAVHELDELYSETSKYNDMVQKWKQLIKEAKGE